MKTGGAPAESPLTRLADDQGLLQEGVGGALGGHPPASMPPLSFPSPAFLTLGPSHGWDASSPMSAAGGLGLAWPRRSHL